MKIYVYLAMAIF